MSIFYRTLDADEIVFICGLVVLISSLTALYILAELDRDGR